MNTQKERPIIFNSDMVRAILSGQKTQTRRPITASRIKAFSDAAALGECSDFLGYGQLGINDLSYVLEFCPFGQPGDLLWVRETWRKFNASNECGCSEYPCDCPKNGAPIYRATHDDGESKWRPSIHMPRWASRILLRVTAVRVERVQDIDDAGSIAEGVGSGHYIEDGWYWKDWRLSDKDAAVSPMLESAKESFCSLWESIYGNWDANPWVWVVEFERVDNVKGGG